MIVDDVFLASQNLTYLDQITFESIIQQITFIVIIYIYCKF